jgi:hypothetical protein
MNTRRQFLQALLFTAAMPAFAAEAVTATVYFNPS